MKKTLSVLLSLLMVVSCMTCLFTMPASAAEAPLADNTAEALPENLLFVVEGTDLALNDGKVIEAGEYYQLNVTVNADDAAAKTYPTFKTSEGTSVVLNDIVGVRYNTAKPGAVETVYNFTKQAEATEEAAATNAKGTYTYTYVFSAATADVTNIVFPAAVSGANLFALKDTDWDNFYWQGNKVVRYMVEENGNVFQRMYGYRAVGETRLGGGEYEISAKLGGDYYGINFEAGKSYITDYKLRVPTGAVNYLETTSGYKVMPHVGYYETESYDYSEDYAALRDELVEAGKYTEPTEKEGTIFGLEEYRYKMASSRNTTNYLENGQVLYDESYNSYAKFWTNGTGYYFVRRMPSDAQTSSRLGFLDYYKNGVKVVTSNNNIYSGDGNVAAGRRYGEVDAMRETNVWFSANYTVNAPAGKTLEESADSFVSYNADMGSKAIVTKKNGEWVVTPGYNTIIAPSTDSAKVAFAIDYLQIGFVYDLDGIEIYTKVDAPTAVKGLDSNNQLKDIPANDNTTSIELVKTSLVSDSVIVKFNYDATREAYGKFVGWYKGEECVSTSATLTAPLSTYNAADYTAVVEYENYLGNVGGFEAETHNSELQLPNKTITVTSDDGTATKEYLVHDGTPTGNKWGFFKADNANYKLAAGYTYSDANPYLTENGSFVSAGQAAKVFANRMDGGLGGDTINYVYPKTGTKMMRFTSAAASAVKAIEGLTPGKSYYVSFYAATTANSNDSIEYASVGNNVVDIAGSLLANNRGTKVYTNVRNSGKYTKTTAAVESGKQTYTADWKKVTLYFTAENATEYLNLYFVNSHVYVDDFVCKEYNAVNAASEWNFEDGDVEPFGFTTYEMKNVADQAAIPSVEDAAGQNNAALGNKYFKLSASNHRWNNRVNFNFYYDGASKYTVSFDMKVLRYADYVAGQDMKLEFYLAKLDDGFSTTSYGEETALAPYTGLELTRYWQDGSAYEKVVNANTLGQYMYTTKANATGGSDLTFGDDNGGAIWSEWQHFEIEVDPASTNYVGAAEFAINLTGLSFEIGLDNVKINKYSLADIEAADTATNGTYAFNIRAAGEGVAQGLRFKSSIDLDILDNFGAGSKVVEYGTLVMDSLYLNNYKLNRAVAMDKAKAGVAYVGVAYNREKGIDVKYALDDETNVLTYTGVITGIPTNKFGTTWAVRGYVIIEDANANQTVVYDDIYTISIVTAATYIVNESDNADDVAAAQTVLDAYYK